VREAGRGVGIHCPSGLFCKQEKQVTRLTDSINEARTAAEKAPWALKLMEVVDVLLVCERYDDESLDCRLCHSFSALRRKTAALVVKAARLSCRSFAHRCPASAPRCMVEQSNHYRSQE